MGDYGSAIVARRRPRPRIPEPGLGLALVLAASACEEVPRSFSVGPAGAEPLFSDRFERSKLGPSWRTTGPGARLEHGRLVLEGLENHPVWLTVPLPDDVHLRFDARAATDSCDVKFELAGDGKSYATSPNYVASGYVVIFGGWECTKNMISRRNEHGRDVVTSTAPLPVPGRTYRMDVWRTGDTIRWEVDGREVLVYEDPNPLRGPGHRHFAFNNWQARTEFDNLVIEPL